jgi:hypothetical protein
MAAWPMAPDRKMIDPRLQGPSIALRERKYQNIMAAARLARCYEYK